MVKILWFFFVCAGPLAVSACDGAERRYPPGYTDDGVKFDEDGWRYFPSDQRAMISYFPTAGRAKVTFNCNLPEDKSATSKGLKLDRLEVTTGEFEPLQQWPQPDLDVRIGAGQAANQAMLDPWEGKNPNMTVAIDGRQRALLLRGIRHGKPITLSFADQTREIPGPPQSMREAFADKCEGKR